jgi:hypothetical protein
MKLKHLKTATRVRPQAPADLRPRRHINFRVDRSPFVALTVGILVQQFV